MLTDYRVYAVTKNIIDHEFKRSWNLEINKNDIIYHNGSWIILLKHSTKENHNIRCNFLYDHELKRRYVQKIGL